MTLDATWVREWMRLSSETVSANKVELGRLDREIGDGDHGENLERGFHAVLTKLDALDADTAPGAVLKAAAMALVSSVGGASGPLYGTAFLKGADALGDAAELDAAAVVAMMTAARDGIVLRGKAEVGDKTMVDAWTPAVDAASQAAADEEAGVAEVLASAADAAATGAEATEPLVAHKGRASYLGERSAGHRDPGAQSTALLLAAAAQAAS